MTVVDSLEDSMGDFGRDLQPTNDLALSKIALTLALIPKLMKTK